MTSATSRTAAWPPALCGLASAIAAVASSVRTGSVFHEWVMSSLLMQALRTRLPLPDARVFVEELRQLRSRHHAQRLDERRVEEPAILEVFLDRVQRDALGRERADVRADVGVMALLPAANRERGRALVCHRVADRVAREEQAEVAARALHRMREPHDRVVLLLHRRAIGRLENLECLHRMLLQRVPTVSVLPDSTDSFQRSAGVPRRTPSMASFMPRSSTQSPQFTQSSLRPCFAASFRSSSTQTRGSGWFSAEASRPCTAFACGAWRAKDSPTAPS